MDYLIFDFHSLRSEEVRLSVRLLGLIATLLLWLFWLLMLLGVALIVALGAEIGWIVIAFATVVYCVWQYYVHHLKLLLASWGMDVDDVVEVPVLGRLSARPTPSEIAAVVGQISSGQFMGVRFGLMLLLLSMMASSDEAQI